MSLTLKRKITTILEYIILSFIYEFLSTKFEYYNFTNQIVRNLSIIIIVFLFHAILIFYNLSIQSLLFKQKLVTLKEEKVVFFKVLLRTIGKPFILFFHYFFSLRNWLFESAFDKKGLSIVDNIFQTKWINK